MDNQAKIKELNAKLDKLLDQQNYFYREINELRLEISKLSNLKIADEEKEIPLNPWIEKKEESTKKISRVKTTSSFPEILTEKTRKVRTHKKKSTFSSEKFIGENLINKIGIAITVIGVAIGAKYSIEHELISPLTRIIMGYIMGILLLLTGIYLKRKYHDYSAVLISGAMAIMYFITFFAYSFYGLMPQLTSFILMLVFTAFTVFTAIHYNRQLIAHIGLVGAYAVPFLLSEGTGRVEILFTYMVMINIGILILAFKRYWKSLHYASFIFTWFIYISWISSEFEINTHFTIAFVFLSVFFFIFYASFLSYKLLKNEKYSADDILLLLANSVIFYSGGIYLLNSHENGDELIGIYTLLNAVIHSAVSFVIYRKKAIDRNLFYLIAGLVLIFLTITIPVQLNGKWVTLLWAGEAALLFWIGRSKQVYFYEKFSYPLMLVAFISLWDDWQNMYDSLGNITPILNPYFLTSLIFIAAFGIINYINQNSKYPSPLSLRGNPYRIFSVIIPAILIFVVYYTFFLEIKAYWDLQMEFYFRDEFKIIWLINYTLLFTSFLAFLNFKKIKSTGLAIVNLWFSALSIIIFLGLGLYLLSELRENYLGTESILGFFSITLRYISYCFVAFTLLTMYLNVKSGLIKENLLKAFDLTLHTTILWILSSELIHLLDMSGYNQTYKLGLSILWGTYSLILIIMGIGKSKKHLRMTAFGLFAVTLIKLFVYDISHLETIAKTIVLVSLGILLLIISFLYNKHRKNLFADAEE